jgi:hypothetical protein
MTTYNRKYRERLTNRTTARKSGAPLLTAQRLGCEGGRERNEQA